MLTDLIGTPYKIYQVKGNKYNLDSILLANFVGKINKKLKIFMILVVETVF